MDRVRFETYRDRRILMIDCAGCSPAELIEIFTQVREIVTAEPRNSVLSLTDFTGAEFNRDAITRMKEVAAVDRPHVLKAAMIGAETMPPVYHSALQIFSVREFPAFSTREEALEYLLKNDAAGRQSA